ncbi:NADPH-dependent FMN reductase [Winogradskya consettensis]|uniref:NADPH-dependent FMN reductase n=1 Tax=Winogradskya consettensis TaxID=113560 RepID=UPI001BB3EBA3|nr:NAD(P)H-dependent oxidoreductase [Actinoplanes consettensis]
MTDVVVICGHPRPGSRTLQLARAVGERLAGPGKRCTVALVDIAELGPALLVPGDDRTGHALADVQEATLLIVATPTCQGSYSGALKAFLDQLPANALAGVVAVPVVTATFQSQADATEAFLARLLRELGADVVDFGLTAIETEMADLPGVADQYAAAFSA